MHDKALLISCIICRASFASRRGLNTHRWQMHRFDHFTADIQCHQCGADLTAVNWQPSRQKANYRICKDCQYKTNKPACIHRRTTKRTHIYAVRKVWGQNVRMKARELLGGKCQLCGATEDLHFAHIRYHRNKRISGQQSASQVLKTPKDFLLLCIDCHFHPEPFLKELLDRREGRDASYATKEPLRSRKVG